MDPTTPEGRFLARFPAYPRTAELDRLRATEFARLDRHGHVYLDYTGGGLYAQSQVDTHANLLREGVFGNPHSINPTSLATTEKVESARRAILEYFNAPDEYVLVFTANASGALKLVGESYPFEPGSGFLLTFDNHNSVNGIREFARAKGARVVYSPVVPPDLAIDDARLDEQLLAIDPARPHLFAYPAQSNFSGVQHSLDWVARARERGWDVLLDAAAFAPTNRLDLSRVQPDFVSLSFYKMFGYPTGVGALLARRSALAKLRRPWFAGGTIEVASVQGDRHYFHEGPEAFEDGTLNYLALPAVETGLRFLERVGVDAIHDRVGALTSWLLDELGAARHGSGRPLVQIYGPTGMRSRGGTVTLNFYAADGRFVDHRIIERLAAHERISLRTGCFCNPGGGELALGISAGELASCFVKHDRMTLDEFRRCIDDKSTGAVRVSVGIASNFADVQRFVAFARGLVDRDVTEVARAALG